jgi:hypothetical protein
VAANSLELARQGVPKQPFYLTGQLDGQPFSVHRKGDRIVLRRAEGSAQEVELVRPPEETSSAGDDGESRKQPSAEQELPRPVCPDGSPSMAGWPTDAEPPLPGTSALDESLAQSAEASDDPSPQMPSPQMPSPQMPSPQMPSPQTSQDVREQPSLRERREGKGGDA